MVGQIHVHSHTYMRTPPHVPSSLPGSIHISWHVRHTCGHGPGMYHMVGDRSTIHIWGWRAPGLSPALHFKAYTDTLKMKSGQCLGCHVRVTPACKIRLSSGSVSSSMLQKVLLRPRTSIGIFFVLILFLPVGLGVVFLVLFVSFCLSYSSLRKTAGGFSIPLEDIKSYQHLGLPPYHHYLQFLERKDDVLSVKEPWTGHQKIEIRVPVLPLSCWSVGLDPG